MDSGEIQLNLSIPKDYRAEAYVKKNDKPRKIKYRFNQSKKRKSKIKPKLISLIEKNEKPLQAKSVPKPKQKPMHSKDGPEKESGFAGSVLRGEVLPKVFPTEGKLYFPHLSLKTSEQNSGNDETSKEKQSKKKLLSRKGNVGNPKRMEGKEKKKTMGAKGKDFASFINRSKHAAGSTKILGKVTSSGAGRKIVRGTEKDSGVSQGEFKFGFVDLAVDSGPKKTVDLTGNNAGDEPAIKPATNIPRHDFNRTRRMKQKNTKIVSDGSSPEKDSNRLPEDWTIGDLGLDEQMIPSAAVRRQKKGGADRAVHVWNASLFRSNPEIPAVPRRAVHPVHEPIFSDQQFSDLQIHKFLVSNLSSMGLERMTTVQRLAAPLVLRGEDVLVRSQTGSGKTLAYAVPLVEMLQRQQPPLTRADGVRALVVVPTRELALQTYECFVKLVKPFARLVPGCLVGGEKRKSEKARLRKGITILVGTPGRILDHVQHTRSLRLDRVQHLVLDEADCLLDMGYERDIGSLVSELDAQSKPLLPKEAIDWNRKTYGIAGETSNKYSKNEKNKTPGYISQDSGAEDEDTNEENEEKEKEMKRETVPRRREEDETSDYDPEERADEIVNFLDVEEEEEDDEKEEEDGEEEEKEQSEVGEKSKRQTLLLSATLTPAVERLAGLTLRSPLFVDAADVENEAEAPMHGDSVVIPDSLHQSYMVVPAKLRLVTLSAFIVWKCKFTEERKMLLFCATQDMVDYLTELLTIGLSLKDTDEADSSDEEDEEGNFNVGVDFFRLHGSMNQNERTLVFQTFRASECGVLLCTDVAARGLDLPRVDWILQLTAPGSVAEYVHRVGRTARIGTQGSALLFLLPTEADFVSLLQDKRIRLQEEKMETCLKKLALANSSTNFKRHTPASVEEAATTLQLRYERAVLARESLHDAAIKAYVSYVRFYASYPKDVRDVFCFKALHLGHHAKCFALRDPPSSIGGLGRRRFFEQGESAKKSRPRVGRWGARPAGAPPSAPPQERKRTRELVLSEYSSGLEPLRKQARKDAYT